MRQAPIGSRACCRLGGAGPSRIMRWARASLVRRAVGGGRRVCHGAPATSAPVDHASRASWGRTARLPSQHGGRRRRRGTAPAWPSPPANPAPPSSRAPAPWALRRLDAWLDDRQLEDRTLASYRPRPAVAAACFRARLAGEPSPTGERTGPSPGRLPAARRRSRPGGDFSGR